MTLNKEVLEAGRKVGQSVIPSVPEQVVQRIVQAYLDAAGLVERSVVEGFRRSRQEFKDAAAEARYERDEARREADDYLHELVDEHARSDDAFKQQAALREAIMQSIDVERSGSAIRAALTDTAKAAAQYQRVPEGWTLKPEQPTDDMLSAGGKVQIYSPIVGHLGKKIALAVYGRMYAAASKAGEGPEADVE